MGWGRVPKEFRREAALRTAERKAMKAGVERVKTESRLAAAKSKVELLALAVEKARSKEAEAAERVRKARKALEEAT